MDLNSPFNVFSLLVFVNILVVPPTVSVAGNFPVSGLFHGSHGLNITFQCHPNSENGNGKISTFEKSVQPPKSTSGTVVVNAFGIQTALALQRFESWTDIRQQTFAPGIAMQRAHFSTLFVVDNEIQRHFGRSGPMWLNGYYSVSQHVTRKPVLGLSIVFMVGVLPFMRRCFLESRRRRRFLVFSCLIRCSNRCCFFLRDGGWGWICH
mmetsp:Transcript_18717/g.32985  ORF Transcript_18717/g.32985 Transcript_18717/m.32985 type:complete len:208 (+) Transcript_18717:237-860(+)